MLTVNFLLGMHIRDAAKFLIEQAPAAGSFNGIELSAAGGETPEEIVALFTRLSDERATQYRASPEGIAAEDRRLAGIKRGQAVHDDLVARLPALDFQDDAAVLDWLCAIQDTTDTTGVLVDKNTILIAFAEKGYMPNVNCGDAFDGNNRDNFHRWLVGQALDGLASVAIHPMIHKFADDWRERFAVAA